VPVNGRAWIQLERDGRGHGVEAKLHLPGEKIGQGRCIAAVLHKTMLTPVMTLNSRLPDGSTPAQP